MLVALTLGLVLGAACAWLILRSRMDAAAAKAQSESQLEAARLNERIADLRQTQGAGEATANANRKEIARLVDENRDLALTRDQLIAENRSLASQLAEVTANLGSERKQAGEKLALLKEAKEQLSLEFKALAGEILEVNAKRFSEQHQTDLGQLLTPLKTRLSEFQGKVEEVYVQEGKDRAALGEQVKHLLALNQQLSQDAHNLTMALKGSSKAQGNWGEIILERVLESSGLRKGHEYDIQESHLREDGSRAQPDVVVHLPEGRDLVVDAKVSLTAYEEYVVADSDVGPEAAIRRHVESVRTHIRSLSQRNYQTLYTLKSLDFVLLFVPIEPAFMLAIAHDDELWQFAWTRSVLLVSPSTLLFVLRTVAHLWRQEQQSRNAQDIAKRGAELYDKLVGFVDDLLSVGNRLAQAQTAYDDAYSKFTGGKGNVVRQAELLKGLGVKPTKTLPATVLELAMHEQLSLSPGPDGDDST